MWVKSGRVGTERDRIPPLILTVSNPGALSSHTGDDGS